MSPTTAARTLPDIPFAPAAASLPASRVPADVTPRTTVMRDVPKTAQDLVGEPHVTYRRSASFGKLFAALGKAQSEFGPIEKTRQAEVQSRREGARGYSYKFADLSDVLEAVRTVLNANGLTVSQPFRVCRDRVIVTTMLVHGESEQWFEADVEMPIEPGGAQSVGSATTYAKRYGATSLLGIAAREEEPDDDGAAATRGARPELPAPPEGFMTWRGLLEKAVPGGLDKLEGVWRKGTVEHRAYLARTEPRAVDELKQRAAAAADPRSR